MECTTRTTCETRTIQEDARVLNQSSDNFTVLFDPGCAVLALALELPLILGEPLGGLFDASLVLLVDEMGPVAAASLDELLRRSRQHALAPRAKDARPITFEEGHVEHPGLFASFVFETDPFARVGGYLSHAAKLVGVTRRDVHLYTFRHDRH